jgi:hypothetical protein
MKEQTKKTSYFSLLCGIINCGCPILIRIKNEDKKNKRFIKNDYLYFTSSIDFFSFIIEKNMLLVVIVIFKALIHFIACLLL